ncbi:MAG: carboxy-S-adenosyl-L-methionine synthase CmoA [Porticoccaceae bacterium]
MSGRDDLFARPLGTVADFIFDDDVVSVFPDMIKRSVPGYETIIAMTGTLAEKYVQEDSNCYDLGSSLGASTLAIARNIGTRRAALIAVDNSAAMISRCRTVLDSQNLNRRIELHCADIRQVAIANASMVVLNFTLQFVPVEDRDALLATIYNGLNPGGILVLSEKVRFADEGLDSLMIELHHSFKRANGYSDLEVSQKRDALENVLLPETLGAHKARLEKAGFSCADVWFQCFNFASLIAIKS